MKTSKGFEFTVDKETLEDAELVELIARAEAGEVENEPLILFNTLEKLLGKEQKKKLYDSIRDDKGRVPPADLVEAYKEIITLVYDNGDDDVKNS